jgi:N6-L-threonylcarbamoyladenine synthase
MLKLKWTKLGPGAALEQFCSQPLEADLPDIPPLPRPMRGKLGFSYASLHSYVERYIAGREGIENLDMTTRLALARAFQAAAVAHLEEKLLLALGRCFEQKIDIRDVVVSGGVASNQFLRAR